MHDDLVLDILRRVAEVDPGFDASMADRVDQAVRRDWGGERVLIAKTSPRKRAERVRVSLQVAVEVSAGASPSEVASRHGIGRATVYRWLKR